MPETTLHRTGLTTEKPPSLR